jgi:glycosyltransferase involved in cell wall biosynthesis
MRVLALTDRHHQMGRMLASYLEEVGARVVLAGPGPDRPGEFQHSPQGRIGGLLRRGVFGHVDAILILECGGRIICPRDLASLPVKSLFYGIDTPLRFREHLSVAMLCDRVCLVDKASIAAFGEVGVGADWVPLAADPRVHYPVRRSPTHDLVFIGNINPRLHIRRARLLERLKAQYSVLCTTARYEEVANLVGTGRLAFNCSMTGSLNLRVFEMLACCRCLVTDHAPGSGIEDLFEQGVHLALYTEANLEHIVDTLLAQPQLAAEIAMRGYEAVTARHTWAHRAEQMLGVLAESQIGHRPGILKGIQVGSYIAVRRGQDFVAARLTRAHA